MKEIGPNILDVDGVPAFVVLRYEEYQRLVARASASPARLVVSPSSPMEVQYRAALNELTTPTTDREALLPSHESSHSLVPDDGLIPHDVIDSAVQNHWSLVRAWREYLGLNQLVMAQRLGISVSGYVLMESEFAQLSPPCRERLAEGLGVGLQQLVTRRRRKD